MKQRHRGLFYERKRIAPGTRWFAIKAVFFRRKNKKNRFNCVPIKRPESSRQSRDEGHSTGKKQRLIAIRFSTGGTPQVCWAAGGVTVSGAAVRHWYRSPAPARRTGFTCSSQGRNDWDTIGGQPGLW